MMPEWAKNTLAFLAIMVMAFILFSLALGQC
jgi:hypothetical protein